MDILKAILKYGLLRGGWILVLGAVIWWYVSPNAADRQLDRTAKAIRAATSFHEVRTTQGSDHDEKEVTDWACPGTYHSVFTTDFHGKTQDFERETIVVDGKRYERFAGQWTSRVASRGDCPMQLRFVEQNPKDDFRVIKALDLMHKGDKKTGPDGQPCREWELRAKHPDGTVDVSTWCLNLDDDLPRTYDASNAHFLYRWNQPVSVDAPWVPPPAN